MSIEERLESLIKLGKFLSTESTHIDELIRRAEAQNKWFTKDNCTIAIRSIAEFYLDEPSLRSFAAAYKLDKEIKQRRVGLVLAGNIPLVGFHDILCAYLTGHVSMIKLSDKDSVLIPFLTDMLCQIDERNTNYFSYIDRLKDFDAVIATGSDNSAMYFETYFSKYPHIIRKNRHAVAILTGQETEDELMQVGKDIFRYFGLGCRSISKIYVPEGYDSNPIMGQLDHFKDIMHLSLIHI